MFLDAPIETPRLLLRNLLLEDITDRYVSWLNDPEVTRYLEIRFARQTAESTRAYIDQMNASPDNLFLGIFVKDGAAHIGNIKLGPIDPHHKRGDFGVVIGERACWGQGFASEAIEALTAYAFDVLKLDKVSCGLYAANDGSRRAFLKAGWFEEGRRRRHWLCDGVWQDDIQLGCIRERAT
jgi:RimJ/RimL family protein N-acetyltransferase